MSRRRMLYSISAAAALLLLSGCIRTQNYHSARSVFYYRFSSEDPRFKGGYFKDATVHEAYLEFDARGSMYRDRDNHPVQLEAALKQIEDLRHPGGSRQPHKMALYVFIHGWKNNASEQSGNVWGFRRFLSEIGAQHDGIPVMGLYVGWPGASLRMDKFLSFWDREPVADNVGDGELADALRSILKAVKGDHYNDSDQSIAVAIGHSFGGIVLERVATRLLREQWNDPDPNAASPADLFILLNEAGAAAIARPFLMELADKRVTYNDSKGHPHPLLLSMTSGGDVATKFAYPGGEFLSFKRPAKETYSPPDRFGQDSSLPYDLLTAANMVALQSHQIVQNTSGVPCMLTIPISAAVKYCMEPICQDRLNQTPYWIMQLPQIFVPDHSAVFQDYLLNLISAVLGGSGLTERPKSMVAGQALNALPNLPAPPPPAAAQVRERPSMKRSK